MDAVGRSSLNDEIHKRFGRVAAGYAKYRPVCGEQLVQTVLQYCTGRTQVWEPGCGSGQVTGWLANAFDHVLATDPAASAISRAPKMDNVTFAVGSASSCALEDGSVDLIASAQAAHWFDMESFATEANRVAAPDAIVALWCYDRPRVNPDIDSVVDRLYFEVLHGCWDEGRRHIDARYTSLAFPFREFSVEIPDYQAQWDVGQMLGYLRTWSAIDALQQQSSVDGIALVESALRSAWGSGVREVRWPTAVRIGFANDLDPSLLS